MKKTFIAVGIHVVIMILVLISPVLLSLTGKVVYLETDKMDPRSLFRGHYAILGYLAAQNVLPKQMAEEARRLGKPVYVTLTTDRPAEFVSVSLERPKLEENQVCIVGRSRGRGGFGARANSFESIDFPQIAQYFAPKKEAKEIETMRGDDLLAKVKTSKKCNAVLVGLEQL